MNKVFEIAAVALVGIFLLTVNTLWRKTKKKKLK